MNLQTKTKEEKEYTVTYKISNIVANIRLHQDIDLEVITNNFSNSKNNSKQFPGIQIRIRNPKCVVLLFKSGKMVMTGMKKVHHASLVLKDLIKKFSELGITIKKKPHLKIVNIVVSMNFGLPIDLDRATLHLDSSIYEPEIFPGLIYRILDPVKASFLVFSTGKVVSTGMNGEKQIPIAIKYLGTQLKKYKLFDEERDLFF